MDNQGMYSPHDKNIPKQKRKLDAQKDVLSTLRDSVSLLIGILLVFILVFRIVVVSGPSMNDTLVNGDYLLLLGNVFYQEPKQGDIIVAAKQTFRNGEPIIKRVIATEGQEVDIDFNTGIVYVDGAALQEDYTLTPTNRDEGISFPITVEDGCVFVLGDNRNDSKDSRSLEIGQIDCREILGKAIFLLFPGSDSSHLKKDFSRIGGIS